MLKFRKKRAADQSVEPTTLCLDTGLPLVVFHPELIASYRRLITGLLYQGEIPARLAMLGALRGEGVTYTTLAVATTLALDLPSTIAVVELNWWTPNLLHQLQEATQPAGRKRKQPLPPDAGEEGHSVPLSPGVSAILQGTASIDEAMIRTNLPNLSLLPAGNMPVERRPSIARSAELKAFIQDISTRFDHVLLDVPALLSNSDGIAIASLADAGCIVVRQGITPVNMVKLALDEVKHLRMLGVIMNQTKIHMPRWIYNLIPQE